MHDALLALIQAAVIADSGNGGDSTVKVAIITTVGLVMSAAIAAFASTFRRSTPGPAPAPTPTPAPAPAPVPAQPPSDFTRDYIASLVADRQAYRELIVTYQHLREAVALLGHDPDHLIHHQEQQADTT